VSINTNQIKIKFLRMSHLTFTSFLVDLLTFFAWVLALKEEEGEMFLCQHATQDCALYLCVCVCMPCIQCLFIFLYLRRHRRVDTQEREEDEGQISGERARGGRGMGRNSGGEAEERERHDDGGEG
jgi:hypothetical protein